MTGRSQLPSLTGLRFLAALVVVLLHIYDHTSGRTHDLLGPFSRAGFVGVLFFFTLSGFVLTWGARPGVRAFYQRRFARIYPAFVASLAFGLVVMFIIGYHPGVTSVLNLVLLQSWSPHQFTVNMINEPGWSLSAEAFFYALFPFILTPLLRTSRRALAGVALASWAAVAVAGWLAFSSPFEPQMQSFLGRLPPLLIGAFVLGMIAARAQREGWAPRVPLQPALLVASALIILCSWPPMAPYMNLVCLPAIFAVVLAAAQADLEGASSVWRSPRLVQLGAESYCLYLFHFPILDLLTRGPIAMPSALVAILELLISVGVAALMHRIVEQPGERWLRPKHGLSAAVAA